MSSKLPARGLRIWDLPIRLFHWLLVALIAASWWTGEHHEMDWHRRSGYAIVGLLIFRLYWGVFGSSTARFVGFVRGPIAVWRYVRQLRRPYSAAAGHNPAGGWSVLLMLVALIAMVTAGLFSVDVDGLESGPLADFVSFDTGRFAASWHGLIFNVLLALMAFHIAAIVVYLVWLRHDLISPMIHGGRLPESGGDGRAFAAPAWRVALGIAIAFGITYLIVNAYRLF
jgi:cytochrome b